MNKVNKKSGTPSAISVFFIAFFAIALIIVSFFAIDFLGTNEKRGAVTYVIGTEEYKLSGKDAYSSNGLLLVCFDDIAKICEMTVTGTSESKVFYARNSDQRVSLSNGNRIATVNSRTHDMLAPAVLFERGILVPLDFVKENMAGIDTKFEDGKLTVLRGEYNSSTKSEPNYEDVGFTGSVDAPVTQPDDTVKVAPTYDFVADLSSFEEYMNPEDTDAYMILVNRTSTIDENYKPENLVPITNVRKDGRSETMVETAEKALQALFIEMRAAGYTDVSVTSGYRSYDKQKYLYGVYTNNEMAAHPDWSREQAQKEVDTYSARPGTSEHQTGLCVDMHNLGSASQKFARQEVYTWLINNCYKFGFVLRFPEGKEDITGYSFEPWHYRFVGRFHASEMHRLDMCLEEYTAHLAENK
ncbi:MAG: hypothetical protein E7598_08015 [Ruminococcaceae bacterium]|nr:hypothetical protein [Oscillospiraceae bacterium]